MHLPSGFPIASFRRMGWNVGWSTFSLIIILSSTAWGLENPLDDSVEMKMLFQIASGHPVPRQDAKALYANVVDRWKSAEDAERNAIASFALALICIQEEQFADAWKLIVPRESIFEQSEPRLHMQYERWKMWLLLEGKSKELAEKQFRRYASLAFSEDLPDAVRKESMNQLGRFVGILNSDIPTSLVSEALLSKTERIVGKMESKSLRLQFESGKDEAASWGKELLLKIQAFRDAGPGVPEQIVSQLIAEIASAETESDSSRQETVTQAKANEQVDQERKGLIRKRLAILAENEVETPGKPRAPVMPVAPVPAQIFYEAPDPRTGLTPINRARTNSDRARFERELVTYRKRMNEYQGDLQTYPQRLQQWQLTDAARRADIRARQVAVEKEIENHETQLGTLRAELAEEVVELRESRSRAQSLQREAKIAQIALKISKATDGPSKRIARPSHFLMIDFEREARQLQKALHQLDSLSTKDSRRSSP